MYMICVKRGARNISIYGTLRDSLKLLIVTFLVLNSESQL